MASKKRWHTVIMLVRDLDEILIDSLRLTELLSFEVGQGWGVGESHMLSSCTSDVIISDLNGLAGDWVSGSKWILEVLIRKVEELQEHPDWLGSSLNGPVRKSQLRSSPFSNGVVEEPRSLVSGTGVVGSDAWDTHEL